MSQTYTPNCYQSDHVAVTDMANIEANFATLRSVNSGNAAPSNPEAGLLWMDMTSGTNGEQLLKIYNASGTVPAGNSWIAVLCGDADSKVWFYRNTVCDGWKLDSSVTDRVLVLKGGTGLYNANGGTVAGETWSNLKAHTHTGPSHSHSHNHQIYNFIAAGTTSQYYNSGGTATNLGNAGYSAGYHIAQLNSAGDPDRIVNADMYSATDATAGGTGATGAQSTADVRPQAAIGTLQYPDI